MHNSRNSAMRETRRFQRPAEHTPFIMPAQNSLIRRRWWWPVTRHDWERRRKRTQTDRLQV